MYVYITIRVLSLQINIIHILHVVDCCIFVYRKSKSYVTFMNNDVFSVKESHTMINQTFGH